MGVCLSIRWVVGEGDGYECMAQEPDYGIAASWAGLLWDADA